MACIKKGRVRGKLVSLHKRKEEEEEEASAKAKYVLNGYADIHSQVSTPETGQQVRFVRCCYAWSKL